MPTALPLPSEIVKKEDGRFYKNCPECGKEQSYLRKNYAIESYRLSKVCKACSNKKPEHNKHKGYHRDIRVSWYNHKVNDAALRGLEWSITIDDLADLYEAQEGKCSLSGYNLIWSDMSLNESNCSIDRINSHLGYTKNNIQLVHKDINMMKQRFSQPKFLEMCQDIVQYQKPNVGSF